MNKFIKITEQNSKYNSIENKSIDLILKEINGEDQTVAVSINKELNSIKSVIHEVIKCLKNNGRLFYIGSGTSGRMGILDASECPPTFGVDKNLVIGVIAGGDKAIRNSQEFAEDSIFDSFPLLLPTRWDFLNNYQEIVYQTKQLLI